VSSSLLLDQAPTTVVTCTHSAAGLSDLAARHEEEDKIRKKRTRSGRRGRDQEEEDEIRKKTTRSGRRRRDQEEDDEIRKKMTRSACGACTY
jgi:DNA invertase Pin-like site-specific DNA recombinase